MSERPIEDWEYPEPDEDEDDSVDVVVCPSCRELIYEEAEQCPYCGHFVIHSTAALAGRPLWMAVALALAILGIVWITLW